MPDIVRGNIPQYVPVKQVDVVKPSAYQNSTPPTHQKGAVNGLRNTSTGASLGSLLGPYGSLVGAGVGLGTDIWQAVFAKKRAKEANEQSAKAAQEQAARAHAESVSAREWNSEQQQIRRMRMAGLSPGLMYGQMSPSSAQQASPEQQQVHKADTPKFDNESLLRALELLVKQQQADTAQAAQESAAGLQGSQTQLNLIDLLTRNQKNFEEIANLVQLRSKLLSDENLSDAKRLEIYGLFDERLRNLISQTNLSDASARNFNALAQVTEDYGGRLASSEISSNLASADQANANAYYTRNPLTSKTYADTRVSDQTANEIALRYGLQRRKVDFVADLLYEHGFGPNAIPYALDFASALASQSGKSLPDVSFKTLASWFSGDNWIPFISQSLNRSSNERIADSYNEVARERIESYERIAAGHDAVQLEIVDRYITNGAKNFKSTNNSRLNEYRAEYNLLNSVNQSKVLRYIQDLRNDDLDESDISERAAYYTHKLYESQNKR